MLQRDAAIELIKQYILACKLINVNFYKVILYGSYANNTFHEYSDIDLALVSDSFSDDRIENRRKIAKANIKFPLIEPHTFPKEYFEKGDPFIDEIKKTGIEIVI